MHIVPPPIPVPSKSDVIEAFQPCLPSYAGVAKGEPCRLRACENILSEMKAGE